MALQSCNSLMSNQVGDPTDISIRLVDADGVPSQDRFWNKGVIQGSLILVTFALPTDLEQLAKQGRYNIDNVATLCSRNGLDAARSLQGFPFVYDAIGRVDEYRSLPTHGVNGTRSSRWYHFYIGVRRRRGNGLFEYDLASNPQDVCFSLNAVRDTEFGFSSHLSSGTSLLTGEKIRLLLSNRAISQHE